MWFISNDVSFFFVLPSFLFLRVLEFAIVAEVACACALEVSAVSIANVEIFATYLSSCISNPAYRRCSKTNLAHQVLDDRAGLHSLLPLRDLARADMDSKELSDREPGDVPSTPAPPCKRR